jgi:hypothetical protein
MALIWTKKGPYRSMEYKSEAELEGAILQVQDQLFGANRIYLDVKKKIGIKGGVRNIPDAYLIDLNGPKPRIFVLENELAAHDPLRHIAIQILQFSLSFEEEPRGVKRILLEALDSQPEAKTKCERYVEKHGFRNLDHFLEFLIESPFTALVIIDEIPENLENILARKFQFGVEVLELARYQNSDGDCLYHFSPFLADLEPEGTRSTEPRADLSEVDTIVVPAREEGFQETFIGENRWYEIRIHGSMRPQIKYIAVYRVAPISAITHLAPVKSIEPWKDTNKFVVNFVEPAKEIRAIPLLKGGHAKALQNIRYTTRSKLLIAKSLDDVW